MTSRAALRIRVPGWANRDAIKLTQMERQMPLEWDGHYLTIPAAMIEPGQAIELEYDLPTSETTEELPVSHRQFHLAWRGDEVSGCTPAVAIYPKGE
jgi:hypothetical protein